MIWLNEMAGWGGASILKILAAPVIVALTLFVWICSGP